MAFMPKRYVVAVLAFIGTTLISLLLQGGNLLGVFLIPGHEMSYSELGGGEFAHNVGWTFSFLAGALATRYGGATTFGISTALSATVNLLSPFAFRISYWLYVFARFQDGFFQALAFCSLLDIWARWSAPEERSTFVTLSFSGKFIGSVIMFNVVPDIISSKFMFYLVGFLLIIWSIVWLSTVKNDPLDDKSLSDAEKQYLTENVQIVGRQRDSLSTYPWKSILTSKPVWILSIASFIPLLGTMYFMYFSYSFLQRTVGPSYQKTIFEKIFQLLPACCFLLFGYVADFVIKRKYYTSTQIRKSHVCIGFIIFAVLQIIAVVLKQFTENTYLSLLESSRASIEVALLVNAIDLSPGYASLLNGISTTFGIVGYFLSNRVASLVFHVQHGNVISLCCFTLLYVSTAWLYYRWGSAEVRLWDTSRREEHELKKRDNEAQAAML